MTTADLLAPPPAPAPGTAPPRRAGALRSRRRRSALLWFLLLAGPNVALLLVFVYRPLLQSFYLSTLQWNLGSPVARQIGLGNYVELVTSRGFGQVVTTTVVFTVATVGGAMLLGLGLALLLDQKLRGRGFARTVAFAPYVLSGFAVGILWLFIFDPRYGLMREVLSWFGAQSPQWYTERPWPLVMIIVVYLWKNLGYVALIYLAGLQSVPQDLKDAAALDGASPARTLRSIVLPLLTPTTFFLLVTMLLASLQSFDIIKAMTQGGPLGSTTTLMYSVYQESFVNGRAGYASAVATVLFLVLLAVTAVQMRFVQRKVHYA
ncbi:sugar ABC transporter permease [Cellulomonas hominis]|uniref:sn-glycerol 3-phosphate transport system permease protein n=1 Tax=Cellulomonas hominis TaxID=156981 RepID=A0A511FAG2_9CELL|nr:sugar ABC transporter permease [Cellulomonas hominis]MBB5474359.1 sn-glycerol 3-phosphate transport system permease protein [Cellulomonas hominis]MBU5422689.1 sugar ABC transporter permease [Cellulomonas hominis]NKY10073.1 sugar ABC transporter permease [Cellulomonas hominis]GEL45554.1 sn-glycerol-3-phosphate ABC transporter permease UgpA [Cellulomonas hominis]